MFKVIWLLRRKPGITIEQFRAHYENSHARLAQKYFGDLLLSYKRNYETGGEKIARDFWQVKESGI